MRKLVQIFGHALGKEDVAGITAIHNALGHVDSRAGNVRTLIHVDYVADGPAVDAHAQLQLGVFDVRSRNFESAFHRLFRAGVEDQRHAIAGRNFLQPPGRFRFPGLIGVANDLVERLDQRALLVNQTLRVP